MDFTFDEQQRQLQESAQAFFAEFDSAALRCVIDGEANFDAGTWQRLVADMGWTGIGIPEEYDGLGLGQVEIAIVQQEMGRTLHASPFLTNNALVAPAILAAGSAQQKAELLPRLAAGSCIAAFACTGPLGTPGVDGIEVTLTSNGAGFTLSGASSFVVFGQHADLLIVAARDPGSSGVEGISLLALPSTLPGIHIEPLATMDLTRPYASIAFDAVEVSAEQVLGAPGQAGVAFARAQALGNIALAAEQCGGAEKCLAFATDYAKQREQFGRAIGSFQAIKHKLADMMVLVEAAKSAVYYAACTADENPEQLLEAAAVAKAYCADAFFKCAGEAIQIHGGIGYTWEHDAHLYFKRARASMNLLGDSRHQREAIAEQLFSGAIELFGRPVHSPAATTGEIR
jgi:alkylation response protein AidB-like acyl-CoA dehydrogenase